MNRKVGDLIRQEEMRATIGGYMPKPVTREQLAEELQRLRAQQQQLKRQVLDLGCATSRLYRRLDEIAEPPAKAAAPK